MTGEREELYRRLEQSRRLSSVANDALTQQRLRALIVDIEGQLAAADSKDSDALPT